MLSRKASRATAAIKQHTTRNLYLLDEKFKQKQNIEPRSTKRSRSPRKKNTTERQDREHVGFQTKSAQMSLETQPISSIKKSTTEKQGMKTTVVQTKSVSKSLQSESRAARRKSSTERQKTCTERRKPSTEKRKTSIDRRENGTERRDANTKKRKTSTERQDRETPDECMRKSSPTKERSPSKKKTKPKRKSERTNLSIQSHIARLSGGMRDGIVDKTKHCDERTDNQPNKNGENSRRNRKRVERRISECTSLNVSTVKQSESAKEDVSKLNLAQLGYTSKSRPTDTVEDDAARDGNSVIPDSSRSLTESEYCYSSDPDWDTSVSSETSSVDLPARNLGTKIQHNPTPDNGHEDREGMNTGMRSPFRSEYDQSPTESVVSCSSSSSDIESVIEMEQNIGYKKGGPAKVKSEPKHSTTNAKDGKRAKTSLKKISKNEKQEDACKIGKYVRAKNPDVGKRESEIPIRLRAAKQSRRAQSESVVRGSRSKKKRGSPSKRGTSDRKKEKDGRTSRVDKRAIVKDRGKDRRSVDVAANDATKQGKSIEHTNRLKSDEHKVNVSEYESDESLNGEEKESTAGNDEAEYSVERKASVSGEESAFTMDNGEAECIVDKKPSVRFSLPKREDWKYYRCSSDTSMSSLSSDEAMMCDGYSDSSSLSSFISDEIWDSSSDSEENVRQVRKRFVKTRSANVEHKIEDRRCPGFVKTRSTDGELKGSEERAPRISGGEEGSRQSGRRFVKTRSADGERKECDRRAPRPQRDGQDQDGLGYKGQQKSHGTNDMSVNKPDVLKGNATPPYDIKQSEKRRLVKANSEMTNVVTKKSSMKLARCKSANLDRPNDVNAKNVPNKLRMYITPISSHPRSEKELIKYAELQAKARSLKPQGRQTSKVGSTSGKHTSEVVMRHKGDSMDHERSTYTHNKMMTRNKANESVMKELSTPAPDLSRQARHIDKEPREPVRRRSSDHSNNNQMLKKRSRLTTVSLKT